MAESNIKVNGNGPYIITGSFEVIDTEGNQFETKKAVSLCRYFVEYPVHPIPR